MEMKFGKYLVRQEKRNFNAVFKVDYGQKLFLTHKTSWRQATKIAKLLDEAYEEGYEEAKDIYETDMYG
jgi:hypothetical protein